MRNGRLRTTKLLIVICSFFIINYSFANAEAFDDLPYSNPDMMTYFQQEMTSLMRFRVESGLNIPFFASVSTRIAESTYDLEYLKNKHYSAFPGYLTEDSNTSGYRYTSGYNDAQSNSEFNVLIGYNFIGNNTFSFPIFASFGSIESKNHLDEVDLEYKDTLYKGPAFLNDVLSKTFIGVGAFINTDVVKGGIFSGVYWHILDETQIDFPVRDSFYTDAYTNERIENVRENISFKLALVPQVNTSSFAIVGKALDNILGYFGLGEAVLYSAEAEGDSKIAAFASALNLALDLTFNRIDFGFVSLNTQAFYNRGNFDAVAKADTYGIKMLGLFSGFPFGFTLEGGYKCFYSVSKYFISDYKDTGYINANIFVPLKRVTFGMLYQYDNVYNHRFGIAVSTNFFSGYVNLNPTDKGDKFTDTSAFGFGARFRWGGWKANRKKAETTPQAEGE